MGAGVPCHRPGLGEGWGMEVERAASVVLPPARIADRGSRKR